MVVAGPVLGRGEREPLFFSDSPFSHRNHGYPGEPGLTSRFGRTLRLEDRIISLE